MAYSQPQSYRLAQYFEAVSENHLEMVASFLVQHPQLNYHATDCHGNTSLMLAVWKGYICLSQLLIRKGANLDATNDAGQTAVMIASIKGLPKILILLLKAGADPDLPDLCRRTPLMMACQYGLMRTVEVLIRSGADLSSSDERGNTIAQYSSKEMLRFLNQIINPHDPDASQEQWTPTKAKVHFEFNPQKQQQPFDHQRLISQLNMACRQGRVINRAAIQDLVQHPGVSKMVDSFDRMLYQVNLQ